MAQNASEELYQAFRRIAHEPAERQHIEAALAPAITVADRYAQKAARELPPEVSHDDLVSYLYQRVITSMRGNLDPHMDPRQMMTWFYSQLRHAVADALRDLDPLGRRMRDRINAYRRLLQDFERDHNRSATIDEREGLARQVLGPKQLKGTNVKHLIQIITTGISESDRVDDLADPLVADEPDRHEQHMLQALHMAIASVEDDQQFEVLVASVTGGQITSRALWSVAKLAAAEQLRHLGWLDE